MTGINKMQLLKLAFSMDAWRAGYAPDLVWPLVKYAAPIYSGVPTFPQQPYASFPVPNAYGQAGLTNAATARPFGAVARPAPAQPRPVYPGQQAALQHAQGHYSLPYMLATMLNTSMDRLPFHKLPPRFQPDLMMRPNLP